MSNKKRLDEINNKIKIIEAKKKLKEAQYKLNKLKPKKKENIALNISNPLQDSGVNVSKSSINKVENVFSGKRSMALAGVRNPISDSEEMWVKSWWENRKSMDPNFDIDNWFVSSVNMDIPDRNRQIEDFWTGRNQQNTDNFWTGPSMWSKR